MSQVQIAVGYRSKVAYMNETNSGAIYGTIPQNVTYNWFGATTAMTGKVDQKPIVIWRLDGISRFPAFILGGAREVEVDLTYYPQDINVLTDVINYPQSQSYTIVSNFTDIGQVYAINGSVANTVKLMGRTGKALECDITFWSQNFTNSAPTGIVYPTTVATTPFYFVQESVTYSGTLLPRVLEFDVTITNNLVRVFQFGQYYVRAIPRVNATAEGQIKVTMADFTDLTTVMTVSGASLVFNLGIDGLGTTRTLTISTACFVNFEVPSKPEDMISLTLPFKGEGVFVQ